MNVSYLNLKLYAWNRWKESLELAHDYEGEEQVYWRNLCAMALRDYEIYSALYANEIKTRTL
jgi:hypothetical protein